MNFKDRIRLCQPVKINGAVVVMDPFNGNILAMVGGVNYKESKFNRVDLPDPEGPIKE